MNCEASGLGLPPSVGLACIHIGVRWCYHCSKAEADIPGGFNAHNNPGGCPMYLHNKYIVADNDPAQALRMFHEKLQIEAMKRLESDTDAELWLKTLTKYFPNGIFKQA